MIHVHWVMVGVGSGECGGVGRSQSEMSLLVNLLLLLETKKKKKKKKIYFLLFRFAVRKASIT